MPGGAGDRILFLDHGGTRISQAKIGGAATTFLSKATPLPELRPNLSPKVGRTSSSAADLPVSLSRSHGEHPTNRFDRTERQVV